MFLPPNPGEDVGVNLTFPARGAWGVQGLWRQEGALNMGIRGGIAETGNGFTSWLLSAESWGPVDEDPDAPLSVDWVAGVGATFDRDVTWFRVPVGLSIGKKLYAQNLSVEPYALPRVALDVLSPNGGSSNATVNFVLDLGADLQFESGPKLRFGASLGDIHSVGLGLAFPFGRGVSAH